MVIDAAVCFPADGAPHHIDNTEKCRAFALCFFNGGKGVGGFPGLADGHHESVGGEI